MELTPQILDDDTLFDDWIDGLQLTLASEDRDPADRVHAGCALAFFYTLPEDADIPQWGTIPADLPAGLVETWILAFDEQEPHDRRITAAQHVLQGLVDADLAAQGDAILRRELGA